ncbi:MAG: glycogen debranching protein GlgX [Chloroflexota bacterium]
MSGRGSALRQEAAPTPAVLPGTSHPLGPTVTERGVDFSVYSPHASGMELLLFDAVDDAEPASTIVLDRRANRTGGYWHVSVPGIAPGQLYAFRADGPWAPAEGYMFDRTRVLLDPYGRGVATPAAYTRAVPGPADASASMKSVIVDLTDYDWEGDAPLGRPFRDTILYEAHVRGFTANPNSGIPRDVRGTYAGFIEKIPYLQALGITAVELLPVFQFDPLTAAAGLTNYWGYQPVSYFAPHAQYSTRGGAQAAVDEFRDLVKALHRAGLEVILDVVYNHTAEGGPGEATFSYRGLANEHYYTLDAADRSRYLDFTGTGNTLNGTDSIVRRLILDSLRYWVRELHVDGFRFDLAAILSRDITGRPLEYPPTLYDIETEPELAGTKLIAEAWDAGGLYQVGTFVGDRWVEWNGRFRDDVRSFLKGDRGKVGAIGQRVLGSPDVYAGKRREAQQSINFVTCHDGFTLEDVVSYDRKHNEANGEDNRDGNDDNLSWNCGVEGPSDDPDVEQLRRRQVKNALALNLLSVGVPMLLMGDEVRRTQLGNNNGYCQDSELTWFDWEGIERHQDVLRFTRKLTRARRRIQELFDAPEDMTLVELLSTARIEWGGVRFGQPDVGDDSHTLTLTFRARAAVLHLILNAYWETLEFEVPPLDDDLTGWRRVLDTTLDSPDDLPDIADAPAVAGPTYAVGPRSVVVLATSRVDGDRPETNA